MSPGGGQSGNLADLTINFVLKGKDALQQAIAQVQQTVAAFAGAVAGYMQGTSGAMNVVAAGAKMIGVGFAAAASSVGAAAKKIVEGIKSALTETSKLGEAFQRVGDQITVALGAGVAVVGNFVRQGLAAGAMGQLLSFQMERLALTMSGLFRPTILKAIDGVQQLTSWINSLSNQQKANIAHWLEGAAAAAAIGVVLPRIIAGIKGVAAAVLTLGEAIAAGALASGIGAILPLAGLIAQAVTLLTVGTEAGRNALGQLWETVKGVGKAFADIWEKSGMSQFLEETGRQVAALVLTFADAMAGGRGLSEVFAAVIDALKNLIRFSLNLTEAFMPVVQTIASLVIPVIETLSAVLANLNVELLQSIAKWTATALTFVAVLKVIPMVVSAIRSIIAAIRALNVSLVIMQSLSGPKGWATLAAGAAAAAAAIAVYAAMEKNAQEIHEKTGKSKTPSKGGPGNRGADMRRTGGFESLQATYQRIAVAALRASAGAKDPQQQMVEEQQRANQTLNQIRDNTGNPRPVLAR